MEKEEETKEKLKECFCKECGQYLEPFDMRCSSCKTFSHRAPQTERLIVNGRPRIDSICRVGIFYKYGYKNTTLGRVNRRIAAVTYWNSKTPHTVITIDGEPVVDIWDELKIMIDAAIELVAKYVAEQEWDGIPCVSCGKKIVNGAVFKYFDGEFKFCDKDMLYKSPEEKQHSIPIINGVIQND